MEVEIENSEKFLRSLPVSGGFEVPLGYFEEMENKWIKDENEWQLPFSSLPEEESFTIPDSYFQQMNAQVLAKVGQENKMSQHLFISKKNYWLTAIAASFIFVSLYFLVRTKPFFPTPAESELSAEEIADHFSDTEVTEELLCDAGWCNELESLSKDADKSVEPLLDTDLDLIVDEF